MVVYVNCIFTSSSIVWIYFMPFLLLVTGVGSFQVWLVMKAMKTLVPALGTQVPTHVGKHLAAALLGHKVGNKRLAFKCSKVD